MLSGYCIVRCVVGGACSHVVIVLSVVSHCFMCCLSCHGVACCATLLFKLLPCLSCFVSEVSVYVGLILYNICDDLGLYCFLLFTTVVVGDVSVDLILKC